MKKMTRGKNAFMPACIAAFVLFLSSGASAGVKTDECLSCHEGYKNYSHAGISCADCHSTITDLPHADKLPKPVCAACHGKTVKRYDRSIHHEKGLTCTECHEVHFLQKEKKYCLSCHPAPVHKILPSSKKHLGNLQCVACHGKPEKGSISVRIAVKGAARIGPESVDLDGNKVIDRAEWYAFEDLLARKFKDGYTMEKVYRVNGDSHTVMGKPQACETCHSLQGIFSSSRLYVSNGRTFEMAMENAVLVPQLPSVQDYAKTAHGRNGVKCADCHISQKKTGEGRSDNVGVCVGCHKDVEQVYGASIHAKKGAARCVDCHDPHKVKSYKDLGAKERVAVCSRCHKDYLRRHRWLPSTSLHFEHLECATCHSPLSQKSMLFSFVKQTPDGKTPLSYEQLVALYGADPLRAIMDRGNVERGALIGQIFADLKKRERNLVIDASIVVTKVHHDYSVKDKRVRKCVACHSRDATFYDSMFFILAGADSVRYIPVSGTLLSAYPVATFIDFFTVGEGSLTTRDIKMFSALKGGQDGQALGLRFKWIDFFGILLTCFAVLGVSIHVALRILVRR